VVAQVLQGNSLDGPLERAREKLSRADDRAFLGALCFGAVRHAWFNRAIVRALLSRPDQKLKPNLEALLMLGIEQQENMRVAPHAAVSETVAAARSIGLKGATGLVNAVLRRFQRERDELRKTVLQREEVRLNHPKWLLKSLKTDWPDDWQDIVAANNAPAPMWLRVNSALQTRSDYLQQLTALPEVVAEPGRLAETAVQVTPPQPVTALPGFARGAVSVQDQSAQLAGALVAPLKAGRVLDACAAPGGKTGHLMERFGACDVVAVDSSEQRLERLKDNMQRLGHTVDVRCMDLLDPATVAELGRFERILLDAPCTGSGVVRRHPDIKLLRRADDSAKLKERQSTLLHNLFDQLTLGGELLYVTCSVLRAENDAVVGSLFAARDTAQHAPLVAAPDWGRATQYGRQILPGDEGSDGFYFSRIVKRT
jgi:16S rRNA (cytosine967-C5)-methyltransferase